MIGMSIVRNALGMRASRPRSQTAAFMQRAASSPPAGSAGGSPAALARLVAILALLLATPTFAAQVYWQDADTLGAGQIGSLELVFADTEPAAPVTLPHVDGLRVLGAPSQSSDISIMNGRRSASLTLSYPVRAERTGTLHVPAFDVETTDGTEHVAALDVEVGRATVRDASGNARAVEDAVEARLTPTNLTPYAGEVVDLDLRITLTGNHSGQVVGAPSWEPGSSPPSRGATATPCRTGGGNAVRFHTRFAAGQPGRVEIPPADQEVQLETGRGRDPFAGFDPFGAMNGMGGSRLLDSFFGAQTTAVTAHSNAVQLDVKPLPQPAPAGFTGAVGQFTLESTLAPEHPKTGEPVTWTVTLSGTGNWPSGVALPARAVPTDLRTLQPKQRSSFGDNGRFSGEVSEDLVLVPNQPGELALAPVQFTFFNPDSGRYETVEARPPTLAVTGAPLPAAANAPAPVAAADAAPAEQAAAPAPALGAPLAGSATGLAPLPWTDGALLADRAVRARDRRCALRAAPGARGPHIRAASRGARRGPCARRSSPRATPRPSRRASPRCSPGSATPRASSASISPRRRPSNCAASATRVGPTCGRAASAPSTPAATRCRPTGARRRWRSVRRRAAATSAPCSRGRSSPRWRPPPHCCWSSAR